MSKLVGELRVEDTATYNGMFRYGACDYQNSRPKNYHDLS